MRFTFFTRHPWMKAFSLGIAFFLWFVVHEEQHMEVSLNVAVQLRDVPKDLMVAGAVDEVIHLRIAGPRTRVKNIDRRFFKPYDLDLSDARRGVNSFSVYEEDFSIPRGTRVSRISPQVIRVNLDAAEERQIRVEPRFVGMLEEGFELEKYVVTPSFLTVKGPRSELAGVRSFPTEPINLVGRRGTFEETYAVREIRPQWEADQRKVSVSVQILEKDVTRILEDIPVAIPASLSNLKADPPAIMVKLQGPAGRIKALAKTDLTIVADEAELESRSKKVRHSFRYVLPELKREGIQITLMPDAVRILVKK